MREAKFICPKCGGNNLTQVISDCTVYASFDGITIHSAFDGSAVHAERAVDACEDDNWEANNCAEFFFQCYDCGHELEGVNNIEDLAQWLLDHGSVEPDLEKAVKCIEPRKE